MDIKSAIILVLAGLGLFLLGSGLSGFAVYDQNCCLPSPFCHEVKDCDFSSSSIENKEDRNQHMEFIIIGLLVLILLLTLYNNTNFFEDIKKIR